MADVARHTIEVQPQREESMNARHEQRVSNIDWTCDRRKPLGPQSKRQKRLWRINWWPVFGLLAVAASGTWVVTMLWSVYESLKRCSH